VGLSYAQTDGLRGGHMKQCTGNYNQGRNVCDCTGLEGDYGIYDRQSFLQRDLEEEKWNKIGNWLLLATVLYFGYHLTHFFLN